MLAQNGAFPVAALALFGLVAITDVADAMVIIGAICTVLIWVINSRPHIRRITAADVAAAPSGGAAARR